MWRRLIKPQAVGSTPRAFPEPGSLAAPLAAPTAAAEAAAPTAPGASDPDLHDPTDPMNWPEASRDFEITQEMIDRMRAKDPELVESIAKLDLMEQDTPMVLSDPTLPKVETQRRHPLMPLSRTSTTGSISLAHRPGRLSSAQTSLFFSLAREIELDLHPSGSAGYSVIPPDRLTGLAHSFDLPPATAEGLLRNYCVPLTIRDQDGTVHGAWSIPEDVPLPKIRSGERNVVRPLTAMLIQHHRTKLAEAQADVRKQARAALEKRQSVGADEIGYFDGPSEDTPVLKPSWLKDEDNARVFFHDRL